MEGIIVTGISQMMSLNDTDLEDYSGILTLISAKVHFN